MKHTPAERWVIRQGVLIFNQSLPAPNEGRLLAFLPDDLRACERDLRDRGEARHAGYTYRLPSLDAGARQGRKMWRGR